MDFCLSIDQLHKRLADHCVFSDIIDVRSQKEFLDDHIIDAVHFPLLDDEERISIGTAYKGNSFDGRRLGLLCALENFSRIFEQHLMHKPISWTPLVYCWRGGMRSRFVVTLLRQVGWPAYQLQGGYTAYRRWIFSYLAEHIQKFRFVVLAGRTLSGKSRLLQSIHELGGQVLDLEKIACHRSSLLGGYCDQKQPTQKFFDSQVVYTLSQFDCRRVVFVESESKKIGCLHCGEQLIQHIRQSPYVFIEADEAVRLAVAQHDYYENFCHNVPYYRAVLSESLARYLPKILFQQLLGLLDSTDPESFAQFVTKMLKHYYDPHYDRSLGKHYANRLPQETLRVTNDTHWLDMARFLIEKFNFESL